MICVIGTCSKMRIRRCGYVVLLSFSPTSFLTTFCSFRDQIQEETGAVITTKGVWVPDRSRATEKDPPLYLHIAAATPESLRKAIDKVNELIAIDLGPLVEDKKDRLREKVRTDSSPGIYNLSVRPFFLSYLLCSGNGPEKRSLSTSRPFATSTSVQK